MKNIQKITDNHAFVVDFTLFWIIFGWLAFVCSLLDFFHAWIFIAYSFLVGTYLVWTLAKKRRVFRFSVDFVVANILIFISVLVFSFFVTPTVFTGRDQGSISNAAISLADNHRIEFSNTASREFFSIYGKGKAVNFPGFHYTQDGALITQFPLGYISWLGAFYSVFGLSGLILANAVCLYIFLLTLYIIGKKLLKIRYSALLLLFSITSFTFVWFFKFTLSENLAMALLWTMILSILYMKKNPDNKNLVLFALSSTLLLFTRIEGYAFLVTGIVTMLCDKNIRSFLMTKKKQLAFFMVFFAIVFAANFAKNFPFFVEMGKVLAGTITGGDDKAIQGSEQIFSSTIRMLQIHTLYGLTLFMIFGSIGAIKAFAEKTRTILVPLAVALPSLIYVIEPNISSDHPWMLRRFVFAVLPLFIFYTVYLLKVMLEKTPSTARHPMLSRYSAVLIFAIIMFFNLESFTRYAFYSEDRNLLEQTMEISEKFSDKDLIVVDQLASKNGWAMFPGPMRTLFGKQAVYLTNPEDLSRIDTKKFNSVYLITPTEHLSYYAATSIGNKLSVYDRYHIETTRLVEKKSSSLLPLLRYPAKEPISVNGYILKLEN